MNGIDAMYWLSEIDAEMDSYLEDVGECEQDTYRYGFSTLPELRELMERRLGAKLGKRDALEAAKDAFRNKPTEESVCALDEDRTVVDFIYQM